ncbi:TPA: hypothetical protein ACYIXH_002748 [Staphylococcus aureus]
MGILEGINKYKQKKGLLKYDDMIRNMEELRKDINTLMENLNKYIVDLSREETDQELIEEVVADIDKDLEILSDEDTTLANRIKQAQELQEQSGDKSAAERIKQLEAFNEEYVKVTSRFSELDEEATNKLGPLNNGSSR